MLFLLQKQRDHVKQQHNKLNRAKALEKTYTKKAKSACTSLITSPKGIMGAFALGAIREEANEKNISLKKIAIKRFIISELANIF
ncbi:hypothetical protein J8L70_12060 [Pseudoalteromonas sp. MMG010]|uniref:hypothetical protein n=1 Tax=Pseudoalteromonas sp. MMG010 TaxID=2822685 RepID=UPI001B39DFA0|nr:hypothetical protein [Pseudoalteromonas sp. MMG010]MBQ4833979.1 hypothetical protein [Pseudoalteromonas sp. MMG010]